MTTTLVTGAAGMIGSHVVDVLLSLGHRVVAIDDLSGGFRENVSPDADFYQVSILDHEQLNGLFERYRPEVVYHLAAYAAEGLSHFIKRFNALNNIVGSVNVINACINYGSRRIVFTSSAAVYGEAEEPLTEDTVPYPLDSYGIAKYAVEQELAASRAMFGLEYVVFRPHNVYGPRQNIADRYRNVVGIFMNQTMKSQPLTVFGDGLQTRQFTYIDDVADVIARAGWIDSFCNNVINVGSDTSCTILELAGLVMEVLGASVDILHLEPRCEARHVSPTHDKLKRLHPEWTTTPLPLGLRRMAEWARQWGPRQVGVFQEIEVHKNLPPTWQIAG